MRITRLWRESFSLLTAATLGLLAIVGSGATMAAAQDNPYNLIDPNVIAVGTQGDAKPYAFTNAEGQFTGFDIELFLAVAEHMGFKKDQVSFTGQDFSSLIPSVANGRFDIAVASIGVTDKRKEVIDYSDDYFLPYVSLMTSDAKLATAEDLKGRRVGVLQGTLIETYAVEHFTGADIVKFPDNNSGVLALNNGTIDAQFLEETLAKEYIQRYDNLKITFNVARFDTPSAFVIHKGNAAFQAALNKGLQEVMADGTWKTLYEKWFPGSPMPDKYLPKK